jgi:hypothetical protein
LTVVKKKKFTDLPFSAGKGLLQASLQAIGRGGIFETTADLSDIRGLVTA